MDGPDFPELKMITPKRLLSKIDALDEDYEYIKQKELLLIYEFGKLKKRQRKIEKPWIVKNL